MSHGHAHEGDVLAQLTDQKLANPNPDFFSYTMSKHAVASAVPMLAINILSTFPYQREIRYHYAALVLTGAGPTPPPLPRRTPAQPTRNPTALCSIS